MGESHACREPQSESEIGRRDPKAGAGQGPGGPGGGPEAELRVGVGSLLGDYRRGRGGFPRGV